MTTMNAKTIALVLATLSSAAFADEQTAPPAAPPPAAASTPPSAPAQVATPANAPQSTAPASAPACERCRAGASWGEGWGPMGVHHWHDRWPQAWGFDQRLHVALGVGGGVAYSEGGLHAELRYQRWGIFLSGGMGFHREDLQAGSFLSGAGIRRYFGGSDRFFLSLSSAFLHDASDSHPFLKLDAITAQVGYRFHFFRIAFAELALGGGATTHRWFSFDPRTGTALPPRPFYWTPDFSAAIGIQL